MEFLFSVLGVLTGIAIWNTIKGLIPKRNNEVEQKKESAPQISNFNFDTTKLEKLILALPEQVVTSVTNTSNTHKGKLGELVGYLSIKGEYDRLIPLGNIVDFIGIRFPKGDAPGRVDFIDVKTGQNAKLSKEQSQLKKLLLTKAVDFRTIKILEIEGLDVGEEDRTTPDR